MARKPVSRSPVVLRIPQPDVVNRYRLQSGPQPRTIFIIALIVSLLVHAAIMLPLRQLALGYISLEDEADASTFTIERSDRDMLIGDDLGMSDVARMEAEPSALSEVLLSDKTLPDQPSLEPPPPAIPVKDQKPAPGEDDRKPPAPPVGVKAEMLGNPNLETSYRPSLAPGVAGAGGEGGDGAGTVDAARMLLQGSGLVKTSDTKPPAFSRTDMREGKMVEVRGPSTGLGAGPDFAQLAVEGARQIDVPERLDNDFEYKVTVYQPRVGRDGRGANAEPGFFRVDITAKRSLHRLKTMPKDVIFLIDTSGSIPQDWVNQITAGVNDALGALDNANDRFNIVFFDESPRFFVNDRVTKVTEQQINTARKFVASGKSKGFTDVNRALSQMLVRDLPATRVYDIIFISDGVATRGVKDTRELINLITRDNSLVAGIYCVGVGNQQNRELLDFLSYRNKGFSRYADKTTEAATEIRSLASRLRFPIIRDVRIAATGDTVREVYPQHLPNIHQGETFSVFGRFDRPGTMKMSLVGHNGKQRFDFTFSRDLSDQPRGDEQIARDWAFVKLHHLYSEMIRQGKDGEEAIRREIEFLRKRYDLKTVY